MVAMDKKGAAAVPPALITLEGIDGCGKSTQARLLAAALERAGYDVLLLREPGGTAISERIRSILLDTENVGMGTTCELLLYEASRAQLVEEVIKPALAAGKVVVCDRFYDSTTAYQAYAGGLDKDMVSRANGIAVGACVPTRTLVFDIEPEVAAARRASREADRMEAKGLEYQRRVAEGFRAIAKAEPGRVRLVPAADDVSHVFVRAVGELEAVGLRIPNEAAREVFTESVGAAGTAG